ncbi:hypothetical protein DFA_02648 [Cavenderia fasciculata]|uniref:Ubiquitin-like protease family profile domain-containing protein n=1 Tax=Cavenderia fasciculata TaxID=261658 RepID=F4PZZ5_CACFS|nr:uncharacterized protein DFA_02648 [Cavenderia fasciculata]EGG18909.1 hypothetical protein DFA_02648 [Cavenderia fasciculata]|eukprot:XP_004357371.1 hypothetical protein DFA_02648 [Cavenderia fasciculata]
MNLDPHNKPGSHWIAVYIDADKDKSVEYYDSFGQEPTDDFMKQLKDLIDEINPDYYLKFKLNKVIDQSSNSTTCGYHAIKFLLNRYNGNEEKLKRRQVKDERSNTLQSKVNRKENRRIGRDD